MNERLRREELWGHADFLYSNTVKVYRIHKKRLFVIDLVSIQVLLLQHHAFIFDIEACYICGWEPFWGHIQECPNRVLAQKTCRVVAQKTCTIIRMAALDCLRGEASLSL